MKKVLLILWTLITIALVVCCVKNCCQSKCKAESQSPLESIYTRTSIRAYTNQPVEAEKIEQILRAGMSAPSAVNKQPWAFIVVDDLAVKSALVDSLPYAKMLASALVAIVVCGDMSKAIEGEGADYWIQDASAATENILLAAHSLGLGAVWTGAFPVKARVNAIREVLELPSHIVPLCVIPMGYPAENPAPKDKWKRENVHKNSWSGVY